MCGREHPKFLVPQKAFHHLIVGRREWTKARLFGCVVKPLGQFLKFTHGNQFAQMPINGIAQKSQILAPVDVAGAQAIRKVRGGALQRRGMQ